MTIGAVGHRRELISGHALNLIRPAQPPIDFPLAAFSPVKNLISPCHKQKAVY